MLLLLLLLMLLLLLNLLRVHDRAAIAVKRFPSLHPAPFVVTVVARCRGDGLPRLTIT